MAAPACDALPGRLGRLGGIDGHAEIRELVLPYYLLLCAFRGTGIFLLAIAHHGQFSIDIKALRQPLTMFVAS